MAANPDPLCQLTISQKNAAGQSGKAADAVHTAVTWFNPCAFGVPIGAFGDLKRNAFRGPSVYNVDFSLFKSVSIGERFKIQGRLEAFNVFNIQNWETPANANLTVNSGTTVISGNTVGVIATNSGKITSLAQGTTPRQIQLGIRLVF